MHITKNIHRHSHECSNKTTSQLEDTEVVHEAPKAFGCRQVFLSSKGPVILSARHTLTSLWNVTVSCFAYRRSKLVTVRRDRVRPERDTVKPLAALGK